jgi:RNA polymerase sigma-70 factor (sigma-E family)
VNAGPEQRSAAAREALRQAYEEHYVSLVKLCSLLAGGRMEAEDVVQDVFVRAAERVQGLAPAEVGPYLRRAVVNTWRNRLRRMALERRPFKRVLPLPVMLGPDVEERDAAWSAIASLAPRQRACLVLRFYEDLSERDVAALLRCSLGTVKSQTSKGLAHLRRVWEL